MKELSADKEEAKAKALSLFEIVDTDKSGSISLDEFLAFYNTADDASADTEQLAKEEFNELDPDHRGFLDEAQFDVFSDDFVDWLVPGM